MILTGQGIAREVALGRIVIDPFDPRFLEPNSYGFHLGSKLLVYEDEVLDCRTPGRVHSLELPESGLLLESGRLYLGRTVERMGSPHYASTLYARRSTCTMGVWIQFSAPLGHTGAITPWTLEIRVMNAVRLYPLMLIGKIAFWLPCGLCQEYEGKYAKATDVVASRLSQECPDEEPFAADSQFLDRAGKTTPE